LSGWDAKSLSVVESHSYPFYEIAVARGTAEVIEHRQMEPVFYVTVDPGVKAKLGVNNGR